MALMLYSVLIALLAPFAFAMEQWRGPWAPGRARERLGFTRVRGRHSLWVHAVSMGEVQAAAPLVRALLERYPERVVVVTTTTSTGAQRVRELFGAKVQHAYLPLDLSFAVRTFLNRVQPALAIVLETELWPNLYHQCSQRGVPLLLASARLSERSVRRYRLLDRLFGGLLRRTLAVAHIAAQSPSDRDRFAAIGARPERLEVMGNLKFDVTLADALLAAGRDQREDIGTARPVWVAGSTHEGEESVLLEAHAQVRARQPATLLVLVPRHPQRFDAAAAELERRGIAFVRRSQTRTPTAQDAVLLVDAMGELQQFYAAADVAFVGGTLIPLGGHNLLEPAALGRPVLCGPHTFNAPGVADRLAQAGALAVVKDATEVAETVSGLLSDPERRADMGARGQAVIAANRGACDRLLSRVAQLLR